MGCASVMAISDRAYIKGGLATQMLAGRPIVLLTVTEGSTPRGFSDCSDAMRNLFGALRRRAGGQFPYVVIPEAHRGQVAHWHGLLAGFTYRQSTTSKNGRRWAGHPSTQHGTALTKTWLRGEFGRYGFGTGFVGLRAVGVIDQALIDATLAGEHEGVTTRGQAAELAFEQSLEATSRYLSKYLTKSGEELDVPKYHHLLRHSRGPAAWWPGHDLVGLRHRGRPELAPGYFDQVRAESREASRLVKAFDAGHWVTNGDLAPSERR